MEFMAMFKKLAILAKQPHHNNANLIIQVNKYDSSRIHKN